MKQREAGLFRTFQFTAEAAAISPVALLAEQGAMNHHLVETAAGRDDRPRRMPCTARRQRQTRRYIPDVVALGLGATQGAIITDNRCWDLDEGARIFARRFAERHGGRVPATLQAEAYAGV